MPDAGAGARRLLLALERDAQAPCGGAEFKVAVRAGGLREAPEPVPSLQLQHGVVLGTGLRWRAGGAAEVELVEQEPPDAAVGRAEAREEGPVPMRKHRPRSAAAAGSRC